MYADPFVADVDTTVASGNTPQTYDLITLPQAGSSVRKNAAVDAGTWPEWLKISHQTVGKGVLTRDRHVVRFEISSDDGDGNIGTTTPAVAYVVFDLPRQNCGDNAAPNLARSLVGFLRTANFDDTNAAYGSGTNFAKFLNGEC